MYKWVNVTMHALWQFTKCAINADYYAQDNTSLPLKVNQNNLSVSLQKMASRCRIKQCIYTSLTSYENSFISTRAKGSSYTE